MESNDVDYATEAAAAGGECSCRAQGVAPAASLAVLQEVHRAYGARLDAIEKRGGRKKLEVSRAAPGGSAVDDLR